MFKVFGFHIAALAILVTMTAPAVAATLGCGDKVGVCDRNDSSEAARPDVRETFGSDGESEGEPENPEARTR
jgi:hypothetical protein